MQLVTSQKWYVKIKLIIGEYYKKEFIVLVDSRADINCIQEGLIPIKYFEKSTHVICTVSREKLDINYKLSNVKICNNKVCILLSFTIIKNMSHNEIILSTPFLHKKILPFGINEKGILGTFKIMKYFLSLLQNLLLVG